MSDVLPTSWQCVGDNLVGPTANLQNADLSNISLSGADLSSANLTGVDLTGSDLYGAILNNVRAIALQRGVLIICQLIGSVSEMTAAVQPQICRMPTLLMPILVMPTWMERT